MVKRVWAWALIVVGCACLLAARNAWNDENATAEQRTSTGQSLAEHLGEPVPDEVEPDHFGAIFGFVFGGLLLTGGVFLVSRNLADPEP